MNDFESQLSAQPLRSAPPEWRADILRRARAAADVPAVALWWHCWLAPQPIALAAAWLVIGFLTLATPGKTTHSAPATVAQWEQWEQRLRLQQALIAETFQPPKPPRPLPAAPHGAAIFRRQETFV